MIPRRNRSNKLFAALRQRLLYLGLLLRRRSLQLMVLKLKEPFVLSGNPFELQWTVKGCYKIRINDTLLLPGNASSVKLPSSYAASNLKICFYGCHKKIERQLPVPLHHVLRKRLAPSLNPRWDLIFGMRQPPTMSAVPKLQGFRLAFRTRDLSLSFSLARPVIVLNLYAPPLSNS